MSLRQGFSVANGVDFETCLALAEREEFDFLELSMDWQFARDRTDAARVREALSARGLDAVVHFPVRIDPCSPHESVRAAGVAELEAALDAAAEYGAERGVYHLGTEVHPEKWDREPVWDAVRETADRLAAYGDRVGVQPVAETAKGAFVDAGDLRALFEETDATACLDTGHAYVSGLDGADQAALLADHGDRIDHVHLQDTRQTGDDEHLPVGMGRIDVEPIAAALADGWSGTVTHELFTFDRSYAAASRDRFDALLASASADVGAGRPRQQDDRDGT
ncbi:sugar phosphate isomerase/epimerase family protein [Halobaculum sp. MBLA0143]|uniref:sugar phosphate isomerase/epimerase family protein n=1 Tax=Halobaculum sp. MBLA0143 TaxID=3079933 RepID=UPI003526BA7B